MPATPYDKYAMFVEFNHCKVWWECDSYLDDDILAINFYNVLVYMLLEELMSYHYGRIGITSIHVQNPNASYDIHAQFHLNWCLTNAMPTSGGRLPTVGVSFSWLLTSEHSKFEYITSSHCGQALSLIHGV